MKISDRLIRGASPYGVRESKKPKPPTAYELRQEKEIAYCLNCEEAKCIGTTAGCPLLRRIT